MLKTESTGQASGIIYQRTHNLQKKSFLFTL
jgi:hypothetical protein